jgi:ribonuclease D
MPAQIELPLLIQSQPDLDRVCDLIANHQQVAVDTEFVRTNTYAPHLGLLQLSAGGTTVCVDPLAAADMQRLWQLLFDSCRTSILHSAKQDLEVMWFGQGDIIHNLIDTQVCAALLGYPAQIGYAGLLAELLQIEIGKTETRTDWSRRPLTHAQLEYAAEDVVHLPEMLQILADRLREKGRYEWAVEDSQMLCDISLYKPEPGDAWQRIKSVPFLPPDQQARARTLATWREKRAVDADKPRQWIISDKALLELAIVNPTTEQAMQRLEELPAGLARKQGAKLLSVLAAANESFARGDEQFEQQIVDIDREKVLSKQMAKLVRAAAEKLDIAAEVVASKRDIIAIIRGDSNARALQGWRLDVVGKGLAELASNS